MTWGSNPKKQNVFKHPALTLPICFDLFMLVFGINTINIVVYTHTLMIVRLRYSTRDLVVIRCITR